MTKFEKRQQARKFKLFVHKSKERKLSRRLLTVAREAGKSFSQDLINHTYAIHRKVRKLGIKYVKSA